MGLLRASARVGSALVVALAALVLHRPLVEVLLFQARRWIVSGPAGDEWLYVYFFRVQIEKLLGIDTSGLWNGGFYYPLDAKSLLLTEPQWGVTVILFPLWGLLEDEFLCLGAGAVIALACGWIAAYGFARHLGASRPAAAVAAVAFGCTTGFLTLLIRPFFWAFGLVVVALVLVDTVCLSRRRAPVIMLGGTFGLLAWCSCHLTVMGFMFAVLQAVFCFRANVATPGASRRLLAAAMLAAILCAIPFVPQAIALSENGFDRTLAVQAEGASNATSLVAGPTSSIGLRLLGMLPPPTGEIIVGIPPIALVVAAAGFLTALALSRGAPRRKPARIAVETVAASAAGAAIALALPARVAAAPTDHATAAIVYAATLGAVALLRTRLSAALRTPAGFYFGCAALFALLCGGPVFRTSGGDAVPSPAALLLQLPGFSGIRATARFGLPCAFALAVSAALSLAAIPRRGLAVAAALVVIVALLLDAMGPAWRAAAPFQNAVHAWTPRSVDVFLRDLPDQGAVLELPISAREAEGPRMYARLFHRRPLVNGYAGMIPDFFKDHWVAPNADIRATGTLSPENVNLLRAFGARYWVVHRNELEPGVRGRLPDAFGSVRSIAALDAGNVLVYEDVEAPLRR